MPLQRAVSILLAAGLLSAAAMTWAANSGAPHDPAAWAAALAFGALAILIGYRLNAPLWSLPGDRIHAQAFAVAAMRNAVVTGLVFGWGAVAMIGLYRLSGLSWQHGLQYAAGMALFALIHVAVARSLASPASRWHHRWTGPSGRRALRWLTILEGDAAAAGLVFLVAMKKLAGTKADWAANVVFLVGGLAVAALCAMAATTFKHLERATVTPEKRPVSRS